MSADRPSAPADARASAPPPHRRVRRIIKWALLVLLILLVVILGLVAWVAGTRSGLAFAWSQIGPRLPKGIEVASVQGRLIGPLEVRGVQVDTDSMHVAVQSVDLDWKASDLLSLTLHVTNLAVAGVTYEVTKTAPPQPKEQSAPFSLPRAIHLPVTVQIDRVAVDNVSAVTAPKATPIVLDRARLINARLADAQWRIQSLTAYGPLFDLDAKAEVKPNGSYATNLQLRGGLRLPNLAPIKAQAEIKGGLNNLKLDANVDAPYNVALTGRVKNALKKPTVDVQVQVKDLHTQAIKADLPKVAANAEVHAQGPVDDLAVTVNADVDSTDYGKAALDGALHYTPAAVRIDHLNVSTPATKGSLAVKGQVALAKDNAMDLTVHWSGLQWPLSGKPAYRSQQGTVRLTGALDNYRLHTDLAWQVVGQTAGKLSVKGTGSTKAFTVSRLDVSGGPGHLSGHAKAVWAPALDVSAHLQGEHINPGAIVADVPGDFDLTADVTAKQKNGVLSASVDTLKAHGSLRHQPLDLNARLRYAGDHVTIDTLHLVSGATSADVSGRFGWTPQAKLDGRWTIDSTDLSTAWPALAGSLKTRGRVTGKVSAPNVNATLTASGIDAYGSKVHDASLDAHVDWSGATRSKVDLNGNGINAAGQAIKKLALEMDGTPASHHLTVKLDSDIAQADLALDGHLDKKTYRERFTLNRLRAAYQKLAPWTLGAPASGAVSASAQSVDNACLTSGDARLCITGGHDTKGSNGHVRLSNFAYTYAKPFFPEGLEVTGAVSGTVDAVLPTDGDPDIDAKLKTTAGHIALADTNGKPVRVLEMQPGTIRARMHNNGLDADLDLPLAGGDGIQAQATVNPGTGALTSHVLHGRVRIGLKSLDFIAKLSPEITTFQGDIQGNLRLSGTLGKPSIAGRAGIEAPKIVLATPGLSLTGVQLTAVGKGDAIDISAAAKSGGGKLDAQGRVLLKTNGQEVNLHLTGDRFQIVNTPDVTAYVSPDLTVKVTPTRVDATGKVTIPKAAITPRNLPAAGATTVSSDQVIVSNKPAAEKAVARAIHADVNVILGKNVRIDGFGLKAELGGNLRVVQEPGSPTTGAGAINISKGSYQAYGQNLDIQHGKILFAGGPVSEPGLDLKAARYPAENVTVGVQVRGNLGNPQVTLFSNPPMSQSEQLSWLLLGRPLEGASGSQSSLVARAALALGTGPGNKVLHGIGNKLGLDEIGIGTPAGGSGTDNDETSLTVGKYLSPKLYVGYGLSLFDQISTLSLRYTLSSHWRLETQSSSKATGGDVIFTIER